MSRRMKFLALLVAAILLLSASAFASGNVSIRVVCSLVLISLCQEYCLLKKQSEKCLSRLLRHVYDACF